MKIRIRVTQKHIDIAYGMLSGDTYVSQSNYCAVSQAAKDTAYFGGVTLGTGHGGIVAYTANKRLYPVRGKRFQKYLDQFDTACSEKDRTKLPKPTSFTFTTEY